MQVIKQIDAASWNLSVGLVLLGALEENSGVRHLSRASNVTQAQGAINHCGGAGLHGEEREMEKKKKAINMFIEAVTRQGRLRHSTVIFVTQVRGRRALDRLCTSQGKRQLDLFDIDELKRKCESTQPGLYG